MPRIAHAESSPGDAAPTDTAPGDTAPLRALPTFGWWVFDSESLASGVPLRAIDAARPQWEAHSTALSLARTLAAGETAATGNPQGERLAGTVQATLAHRAAPFDAWKTPETEAGNETDTSGAQPPASLTEQGIMLGRTLRSLAHPLLPGVIIIEDMQFMGEELAALIDEVSISDPDRPVLIIGTVTPESAQQTEFARWLAHFGTSTEVIDVPQLPAPELIALVREHASRTDDATAMRVVARLGTPLFLELWLTSATVREHIAEHDGAIVLADRPGMGGIDPERAADVLRARWDELPRAERAVLACAVFAHPRRAEGVAPFAAEVLAEACTELLAHVFTPAQLRDALAATVAPAGWCRAEAGVQFFKDGLLAQTAREAAADELRSLGVHRAALRARTQERIEQWLDSVHDEYTLPDTPEASLLARWNVGFAESPMPAPAPTPGRTVVRQHRPHVAALWRIACDAAARFDYVAAIERARQAVSELQRSASLAGEQRERPEWAMRLVIAGWLSEQDQQSEAIDALRELLADMERHAGTLDLATLTVRRDLAIELRDAGVTDEAIGQFRTVIADLTTVTGPASTETLEARAGFAEALGLSGQYDAAVAELRALLPAFMETYGERNSNTFLVRGALAAFLSQSGQPRAAAEQTRMLLEDQEVVLGESDPQVFTTRNNLAVMLLDSGDAAQATEQFKQLVRARAAALGATNPDTLDTRMNLGLALLEAAKPGDAVRELRETLALMQRTLSPGHPSVLRGRAQLAEALGRAGDSRAAAAKLRALERDMARTLGARAADIAQIAKAAKYWERGGPTPA